MRVIIVGGGIVGLSSAWALVKRGHQVTVLEQGMIPNALGASGDHHRIIRRAYAAATGYGPMVSEAFAAWDALWADLGANHLDARGFALFSQYAGDEAEQFRHGLDEGGFGYAMLEDPDWHSRFPFINRDLMRWGLVSSEGGVLHCRKIALGLKAWLLAHGATVHENACVTGIEQDAGTVAIAGQANLSADCIVVAAGGWATRILPALAAQLTVYRTAVTYVEPVDEHRAAWATAPAILDVGGTVGGYIIPPSGGAGLKFGSDHHKVPAEDGDADRNRVPREREGEEILAHFSGCIRALEGYRPQSVVTCAYTFTHDEKFTAERFGKVIAVSACSGHGYKFGAAVGRRTAEAVNTGDMDGFTAWLAPKGSSIGRDTLPVQ
jgi:sarcosine oxidase